MSKPIWGCSERYLVSDYFSLSGTVPFDLPAYFPVNGAIEGQIITNHNNGTILKQETFDKNSILVEQNDFFYKTFIGHIDYGAKVMRTHSLLHGCMNCVGCHTEIATIPAATIGYYPLFATTTLIKEKVDRLFDNGNVLSNQQRNTYNSFNMPITTYISNSKGQEFIYNKSYAWEYYTRTGDIQLYNKNLHGIVTEEEKRIYKPELMPSYPWKNDTKIQRYFNVIDGSVVLSKEDQLMEVSGMFQIQKSVAFSDFNATLKKPQLITVNDEMTSIIWSENGKPLAKCVNSNSENIAATSFEPDDGGSWSINGQPTFSLSAKTGNYIYQLSNAPLAKTLVNGGEYLLSYWSRNGSVAVSGGSQTKLEIGTTVNNWTFYSHYRTLGSNTTLTISGTGDIDELRILPANAQMTTYTYKPLVGITSETDPNGRTTYYEYDTFNRLMHVKDQLGNIIKRFCYNYAGQPINCGGQTFLSQVHSANFQRNNCGTGFTGSTIAFSVPSGMFSSTISPEDAQQKAIAYANANGQAYANTYGTCTQSTTIYARIELDNYYTNWPESYADIVVRFYADPLCQVPITVTNTSISFRKQGSSRDCLGYTDYAYADGVSEIVLEYSALLQSFSDWEHSCGYSYNLLPLSGYVITY